MSDTNTASELNLTQDDFAALLEQSFAEDSPVEGSVVEGRITAIENDLVIIDVGLKTEGRVRCASSQWPARNRQSVSAIGLRCIWNVLKTRWAKPCCRATRHGARKAGPSWNSHSPPKSVSRASFSGASKVALRSISTVQRPFCRAVRSTFVRCAMSHR